MMTEIWCHFFVDGAETNTEEKLEIIRTLVRHSDREDIEIFNYWARKKNIPEIACV